MSGWQPQQDLQHMISLARISGVGSWTALEKHMFTYDVPPDCCARCGTALQLVTCPEPRNTCQLRQPLKLALVLLGHN
jgi:hypothetical protein